MVVVVVVVGAAAAALAVVVVVVVVVVPGAPENTTTEDMTEGTTDMMIEIITTDLTDADPHLLTIAVEHIGPVPDLVPTLHVTTDNRTIPVAGSMVLGLLL